MSTHRFVTFATLAALCFTGVATARTQQRVEGPGIGAALAAVDLTEAQQEQALELRHDKQERADRLAERQQMVDALTAELSKRRPSADALHQLVNDQAAQRTLAAHAQVDDLMALIDTFDKGQREAFIEALSGQELQPLRDELRRR